VQTNYDHWKKDFQFDPRRTFTEHALDNEFSSKDIDLVDL